MCHIMLYAHAGTGKGGSFKNHGLYGQSKAADSSKPVGGGKGGV